VEQAWVDLDRVTIRALIGQIVISCNVHVGPTEAAGLQAPTLFVIGQDLKMQANANVGEAEIGTVTVG
jgi:multidrug resistance efflux pump